MQDFKKLRIWEESHALTLKIYKLTENFPEEERLGLVLQMRQSAVAVSTHIADGAGRIGINHDGFVQFLDMALGSASELEYLLILSRDLGFINAETHDTFEEVIVELKRILVGSMRRRSR